MKIIRFTRPRKMMKLFALFPLFILLFSCSKDGEKKTNAEISYIEAVKLLKQKDYSEAATEFEKIDEDFPFSKWAIKAQTMAVYAHYKNEDYPKIIANVDDFLRLNPASEYVPYMLYMKGLTYYNQIPDIARAQDNTQQASFIFRELMARFPETTYANDAKEKIFFIDEHLAGARMAVGRYQIATRNYVGAIISFNEVISRYRYTKQVPESYFRLVEIYYKLGLRNEGKKIKQQLQKKFPDNDWSSLAENLPS
ncbi:MAG: outer membrane protein assembly factor BamD [Proteobacteria bacterium]|nr:outer membrane protein assembly factor BamD [Pseudomonadota bacterium]